MSLGLSEHSKEVLTGKYNVVVAISLVKNNKRGNALENVKRKHLKSDFSFVEKSSRCLIFSLKKNPILL